MLRCRFALKAFVVVHGQLGFNFLDAQLDLIGSCFFRRDLVLEIPTVAVHESLTGVRQVAVFGSVVPRSVVAEVANR